MKINAMFIIKMTKVNFCQLIIWHILILKPWGDIFMVAKLFLLYLMKTKMVLKEWICLLWLLRWWMKWGILPFLFLLTHSFQRGHFKLVKRKFLYKYFADDIYLSRCFVCWVCNTVWNGIEENKRTFPGCAGE